MTRLTGITQKLISRLQGATDGISDISARLSSGQRINRAVDDPAGVSMLAGLNSRSRLFSTALRNVNDAVSYLNIADAALGSLQDIVIRQTELAAQAANGSYTEVQRRALYDEASSLSAEYERTIATTKFNGKSIFEVNQAALTIHLGPDSTDYVSLSVGQSLSAGISALLEASSSSSTTSYALSSYSTSNNPSSLALSDLNGDGFLDTITADGVTDRVYVLLGNGDGSFKASLSYSGGNDPTDLIARDINGDGASDLLWVNRNTSSLSFMLGNGNGTFKARTQYWIESAPNGIDVGDFNGDGIVDLAAASDQSSSVSILLGNGGGTFAGRVSYAAGRITDVVTKDLNGCVRFSRS